MPSLTTRWSALLRVLLFLLLCATTLAAASPLTRGFPRQWSPFVLGLFTSLVNLVLTALFLRWDRLRMDDAGAALRRTSIPRFALGLLIGLILVALYSVIASQIGHFRFVRVQGMNLSAVIAPAATYIALACREELAFHGYPLRRLEQPFGLWGAQVIVAATFAVEHVLGGVTWLHAIFGAAVGSLLFGMAALATRGLAVPIGMHAAWNFGQWMLGEKETSGLWNIAVTQGFEKQIERTTTIGYLIVMLSATLGFYLLYKSRSSLTSRARSSTVQSETQPSPNR